jgi:hypothetical protein
MFRSKIRHALPMRFQLMEWHLLYSTEKHGTSLSTFMRNLRYAESSLVFIEDSKGNVFGAFASDYWRIQDEYYGTGDTFLFQLAPKPAIFTWKKTNHLFMQSDKVCLSFGGGDE